jgi:hypothetical protein
LREGSRAVLVVTRGGPFPEFFCHKTKFWFWGNAGIIEEQIPVFSMWNAGIFVRGGRHAQEAAGFCTSNWRHRFLREKEFSVAIWLGHVALKLPVKPPKGWAGGLVYFAPPSNLTLANFNGHCFSLLPHGAAGFRTSSGGHYFSRAENDKTCYWGICGVLQGQAPASLAAVKLDMAQVFTGTHAKFPGKLRGVKISF